MMNGSRRYTTGIASIFALLTAGCGGPALNGQSKRAPALPAQQQKFCDRYKAAFAEYGRLTDAEEKEGNPIRKEKLRDQVIDIGGKLLNDEYAIIGPSGEFKDWRGNPDFYRSGSDLIFSTSACPGGPDGVVLQTGSMSIPNSTGRGLRQESTHIPLASPLGQTLASLDMTKSVIVSGKFVWAVKGASAGNGMDDLKESDRFVVGGDTQGFISWRAGGVPFMVRFSSITQAR